MFLCYINWTYVKKNRYIRERQMKRGVLRINRNNNCEMLILSRKRVYMYNCILNSKLLLKARGRGSGVGGEGF